MKKSVTVMRIPVAVIATKKESTLVQYVESGILKRKYIPTDQVAAGYVPEDILSMGIPYGYPWEEMDLKFDSGKFANELHNLEIWTVEDALKSPQKLWSALRAAFSDNLSAILQTARQEKKGVNRNGK